MTQPITAKSPSEILEDFTDEERKVWWWNADGNEKVDWLRSSLASLIEHAIEMMPKENGDVSFTAKENVTFNSATDVSMFYRGYQAALSDCIAALRKVQEEIMK